MIAKAGSGGVSMKFTVGDGVDQVAADRCRLFNASYIICPNIYDDQIRYLAASDGRRVGMIPAFSS